MPVDTIMNKAVFALEELSLPEGETPALFSL